MEQTQTDPTFPQRMLVVKFSYPLIFLIILYFSLIYNLQYGVSTYNPYIFPAVGAFVLLPAIFFFMKKYELMAVAYAFLTVICTDILIFIAGGIDAPGIFWICLFPIWASMILGKRGGYYGIAFVVTTLVVFIILDHYGIGPNVIRDLGIYKRQKLRNLILFLIFSISLFYFYVKTKEKSESTIRLQSEQIATLVKIIYQDLSSPLMILKNRASVFLDNQSQDRKNIEIVHQTIRDLNDLLFNIREIKANQNGHVAIRLDSYHGEAMIEHAIMNVRALFDHFTIVFRNNTYKTFIMCDETFFKRLVLEKSFLIFKLLMKEEDVLHVTTSKDKNTFVIHMELSFLFRGDRGSFTTEEQATLQEDIAEIRRLVRSFYGDVRMKLDFRHYYNQRKSSLTFSFPTVEPR